MVLALVVGVSISGYTCCTGVKAEGLFRPPNGSTTAYVGGIGLRHLSRSVRDRVISGAFISSGSNIGASGVDSATPICWGGLSGCVNAFTRGGSLDEDERYPSEFCCRG